MPQYAWLELHEGLWHLITDLKAKPSQASRNWPDKDVAMAELGEEGWRISDPYQNKLSKRLGLDQRLQGWGLIRTVH